MPRQVITRILLVCAVLLAQQTALAHDYWHASSSAPAQKAPKGDKLCDLHDLLGTVLGVATGSPCAHEPVALPQTGFHSVEQAWADSRPLAAQSRGPPAIS
jgi:hypothetical protein